MPPSESKVKEKLEIFKENFTSFGGRMKYVREKLGFTQAALATQLGFTSHNVISRFEQGRRLPDAEILLRLAALGDFNLHWLITGESSPDGEKWKENYASLLIAFNDYTSKCESNVKDERGRLILEFHKLQEKKSRGEGVSEERIKWLKEEGIPQKDRELAEISKDRGRAYERYYGTPQKNEDESHKPN
jgi:transcriptional regulator with XRE-family HTH domain